MMLPRRMFLFRLVYITAAKRSSVLSNVFSLFCHTCLSHGIDSSHGSVGSAFNLNAACVVVFSQGVERWCAVGRNCQVLSYPYTSFTTTDFFASLQYFGPLRRVGTNHPLQLFSALLTLLSSTPLHRNMIGTRLPVIICRGYERKNKRMD